MALIIAILIGLTCTSFAVVVGFGWRAIRAREYVAHGIELATHQNFAAAREAILVATRLNPALRANPDMQQLYAIILDAKLTDGSIFELRRISQSMPQWPKTQCEAIISDVRFQVIIVIVILLVILVRLAGLF
jgi:hypothetical protein